MSRSDDPGASDPPETPLDSLAESAPLFVISGALFVAGFLFWRDGSTAGPTFFPIWNLLIALGFIAAIGGLISWLFAMPAGAAPGERASPSGSAEEDRDDFGRPRPEVRRRSPVPTPTGGLATAMSSYGMPPRAIWSEDDLPVLPPAPLPRAPARAAPATPSPPRLATGNDGVNLMLAELDDIERAVAPRRRPVQRVSAPP